MFSRESGTSVENIGAYEVVGAPEKCPAGASGNFIDIILESDSSTGEIHTCDPDHRAKELRFEGSDWSNYFQS
jgi:hypothetical protein